MRKLIPAVTLCFTFAILWAAAAHLSAAEKGDSKWEEVKTASGKITSTTVQTGGGNNNNNNRNNKNGKYANTSNYRVKPEYVQFDITGSGMRIKYETKGTGDRPDLKIEVEKQITKPNGDKDWQRVGVAGRSRGDGDGGNAFTSGPGQYRLELTGQHMQYKITIEQPSKKDKD